MAEYGEWNRKGATLSDVTAKKEYGVDREFIVKGIRGGKLEYREGVIWGNPYLRLLRSQLEKYIAPHAYRAKCLVMLRPYPGRSLSAHSSCTDRELLGREFFLQELRIMKAIPPIFPPHPGQSPHHHNRSS